MLKSPLVSNPFALMMDPAAVIAAMESSDRLGRLQSRICRPLDKSVAVRPADDVGTFDDDAAVDNEPDSID